MGIIHPGSWVIGFGAIQVAGKILIARWAAAVESNGKRFRAVCGSEIVPKIWVLELNL